MTYLTTEESLWERKRYYYIMAALMPIGIFLFMYIVLKVRNSDVDMGFMMKIALGISIFLILEILVVGRVMINKLKKLSVIMDETGFNRVNGSSRERFEFKDISSITAVYNPSSTKLVQIKCKGNRTNVVLAGFENMEKIKEHFVNADIEVKDKNQKADWNSPLMIVLVYFATLLFMSLIMMFKYEIFDYVTQLIEVAFGIYIVGFKVISRSAGAKFRKVELILGSLIIVLGSSAIILKLLGM